jgi:pimeloyl-ACP methyl ester carboxylesterase
MEFAKSIDGTRIAFDRVGSGPALVLVGGAFSYRRFPLQMDLAERLSDGFTVVSYDRRGRGDSDDTAPYSVAREIEDLTAVIKAVGGRAAVWGMSSGGALALEAAAHGAPIDRLAVYDPPFVVDREHGVPPTDLIAQVEANLASGRPDAAVRTFMTKGMGAPAIAMVFMRLMPQWKDLRAVAHTIPYDIKVMGPNLRGEPLDPSRWEPITIPVLVNAGTKDGASRQVAAAAVTAALSNARLELLPGEGIGFTPATVEAQLRAFLA